MERANILRRQVTNHLTKARIVIKTRIAKRTRRSRLAPRSPRAALMERIARNPTSTKVPIAHQKISIPAVIVVQSTKAKTKTEIARRIRTGTVAITRAAPAGLNIRARIRSASGLTTTRAQARLTKTNHLRHVITVQPS
jgi:hypothetical protein